MEDSEVLAHIKEITIKEEALYGKEGLSDAQGSELHKLQTDLDQCWDYLRQRRARRDANENPDDAKMRSAEVIKNYIE